MLLIICRLQRIPDIFLLHWSNRIPVFKEQWIIATYMIMLIYWFQNREFLILRGCWFSSPLMQVIKAFIQQPLSLYTLLLFDYFIFIYSFLHLFQWVLSTMVNLNWSSLLVVNYNDLRLDYLGLCFSLWPLCLQIIGWRTNALIYGCIYLIKINDFKHRTNDLRFKCVFFISQTVGHRTWFI